MALLGGLAQRAQEYPPRFCSELVKGMVEQLRTDGGWSVGENYVYVEEDGEEDEFEDGMGNGVRPEEALGEESGEVTIDKAMKIAVIKLYRGIGHPSMPDFVHFMKAARVKSKVIRWTSKHFRYEMYASRPQPKAV